MPTLPCAALRDGELTDATVPVLSPYWRLKRSGRRVLLSKYEPEQATYSILSPLVAATLPLFDGRTTFRHLALVVQYAHDLDGLDAARRLLAAVIAEVNRENDAVVRMDERLAPYVQRYDPLDFVIDPPAPGARERLAAPLLLNLMFSNACETRCVYCYAAQRRVPADRHLPAARWIELFREARALGVEEVSLSGGDPLFRKDALDLIAELIRLRMLFLLSTKCHVTREMADRLVDIGMNEPVNQYVRELQVSMDGPDAATADALAGSPGYFERALDSVRNLVGRGFRFRVKAVLTPLNAHRVREWVELLVGMGVPRLSVAAYNRSWFRHDDRLFLSEQDRIDIGEALRRAQADHPDVEFVITGFHPRLYREPAQAGPAGAGDGAGDGAPRAATKGEAWKTRAHCSGGRSSLTIAPDGKVVLCDTVPQDERFVVGDVSTSSLLDVWNGEALLALAYPARERFAGTACEACPDFTACQDGPGYCFRDSYFNYGTLFAPPPRCPRAPDDGLRTE